MNVEAQFAQEADLAQDEGVVGGGVLADEVGEREGGHQEGVRGYELT